MVTKIGNGIAKGEDGFKAGNTAAKQALEKLDGKKVDVAIVFASLEYHLDCVYNGVKDVIGDVLLIGCSSAGEFTNKEVGTKSVVVSLISSDSHKFFVSSAKDVKENTYEKTLECTQKFPSSVEGFENISYVVLHDGLIARGEKIIDCLTNIVGSEGVFSGGAAGDDLAFKATYVMHNEKVLNNAMAIMMIASKNKVGLGVNHGHVPVSEELEVTKSKENILYNINGRPAWDVWKEQVKEHVKEKEGIDIDTVTEPGKVSEILLKYEMGLNLGNGRYKVRIPLSANLEDGSINFAVEIFEGARFNIMYSEKQKQIDSAKLATQNALDNFHNQNGDDVKIAGALVFDCVCRGLILQDQFKDAVQNISNTLGTNVPLAGFETYGEICKGEGEVFSGFHNTTSVIMILPE
jgi:hypothetical protein